MPESEPHVNVSALYRHYFAHVVYCIDSGIIVTAHFHTVNLCQHNSAKTSSTLAQATETSFRCSVNCFQINLTALSFNMGACAKWEYRGRVI